MMGTQGSDQDVARAAAVGAGLSNLVNNLPAYVAGEAAVPLLDLPPLPGRVPGRGPGWCAGHQLGCLRERGSGVGPGSATLIAENVYWSGAGAPRSPNSRTVATLVLLEGG
jgi:hypothetical protein